MRSIVRGGPARLCAAASVSAWLLQGCASTDNFRTVEGQTPDPKQLEADAARLGGLRLLPGRFMVIQQAMGTPKSRGTAAQAALTQFVEDMKASGFVAEALARAVDPGRAFDTGNHKRLLELDQATGAATLVGTGATATSSSTIGLSRRSSVSDLKVMPSRPTLRLPVL